MAYITEKDYDASIHREILDALSREDASVVQICENRAIADARGYLLNRYDCNALFAQEGGDRNQLLLMMVIDIAVYHLFCAHNPQKLSQIRKDRYERALKWLEEVRDGNHTIEGAPPVIKTEEEKITSSPYQMKSNPKRQNHL